MRTCPCCESPLRQAESGNRFRYEWYCLKCRRPFYPEDLHDAEEHSLNPRLHLTLAICAIGFLNFACGFILGRVT